MPLTIDDVEGFNKLVGASGGWKKPHFRVEIITKLTSLAGNLDLAGVSSLARTICSGQMFSDGNHRTAILCIYLPLIDDAHISLRCRAYQLYAKLDFAFYRAQGGSKYDPDEKTVGDKIIDPMESLYDFLQASGKRKVDDPALRGMERAGKIAEVQNLPAELDLITGKSSGLRPTGIDSELDWDKNKKRSFDATYLRIKDRQKIFMALNGGSLSHSSDR